MVGQITIQQPSSSDGNYSEATKSLTMRLLGKALLSAQFEVRTWTESLVIVKNTEISQTKNINFSKRTCITPTDPYTLTGLSHY